MRNYCEYYLVKSILLFTKLLPKHLVYAFCKTIARLFFKFNQRRSSLTLKNIHLAYPEKSDEEVLLLAKASYESLALTLAEILLMLNDKITIEEMVENTDEAIAKLSLFTQENLNGTVILTGHFSNWELAAHFLAKNGYPMLAVGRKGNNTLIEEKLTTPFREKYGNKNVYKSAAVVAMVKQLKRGCNVGLLIDQKSGGANSIKLTFFNHPADTVNSVALLKLKYNPLILPIFAARQPNGKYKMLVKEPATYTAEEEKDEEVRIQKITQRYNDIIEEVIREYPEQWFWMHDRWRIAK